MDALQVNELFLKCLHAHFLHNGMNETAHSFAEEAGLDVGSEDGQQSGSTVRYALGTSSFLQDWYHTLHQFSQMVQSGTVPKHTQVVKSYACQTDAPPPSESWSADSAFNIFDIVDEICAEQQSNPEQETPPDTEALEDGQVQIQSTHIDLDPVGSIFPSETKIATNPVSTSMSNRSNGQNGGFHGNTMGVLGPTDLHVSKSAATAVEQREKESLEPVESRLNGVATKRVTSIDPPFKRPSLRRSSFSLKGTTKDMSSTHEDRIGILNSSKGRSPSSKSKPKQRADSDMSLSSEEESGTRGRRKGHKRESKKKKKHKKDREKEKYKQRKHRTSSRVLRSDSSHHREFSVLDGSSNPLEDPRLRSGEKNSVNSISNSDLVASPSRYQPRAVRERGRRAAQRSIFDDDSGENSSLVANKSLRRVSRDGNVNVNDSVAKKTKVCGTTDSTVEKPPTEKEDTASESNVRVVNGITYGSSANARNTRVESTSSKRHHVSSRKSRTVSMKRAVRQRFDYIVGEAMQTVTNGTNQVESKPASKNTHNTRGNRPVVGLGIGRASSPAMSKIHPERALYISSTSAVGSSGYHSDRGSWNGFRHQRRITSREKTRSTRSASKSGQNVVHRVEPRSVPVRREVPVRNSSALASAWGVDSEEEQDRDTYSHRHHQQRNSESETIASSAAASFAHDKERVDFNVPKPNTTTSFNELDDMDFMDICDNVPNDVRSVGKQLGGRISLDQYKKTNPTAGAAAH